MQLRAATHAKVEHGTRALATEFDSVPPEEIGREVETVMRRLLESARFDDYIPILVHRATRERLRERVEASPLSEAA